MVGSVDGDKHVLIFCLQNAMGVIGLQKHEQDEIFKMLAIILWLGNIVFVEDDSGNAAISDGDGKDTRRKVPTHRRPNPIDGI